MKQKVALVLSGGGARGIAHIGAIEELEQSGYTISSVAGTSMGAVVGGVHAMGKLPEFKEWLYSLDKLKVFQLVDFTLSTQGLVKGVKVLKAMQEFIEDTKIEDFRIPFSATAVDLIKKEEVVITKGSIYDAIRASIAIPSVFTPVNKGDRLLVDGGVLNNIPLSNVKRTSGDILVAVDVNANIPVYRPKVSKKEEAKSQKKYLLKHSAFQQQLHKILPFDSHERLGYFDLIDKTISLMTERMSLLMLKEYDIELLVKVSCDSCNTFDFFKAEELVEMGRHAARITLNEKRN